MADHPPGATLNTLHEDVTTGFADVKGEMRAGFADLKDEMRAGFADLKTTLVTGFGALPTRESSEEMVRLLREGNRLHEARFGQLEVQLRLQHLEVRQALQTLAEGQTAMTDEIRALIARIDALMRGRGNGAPPA